MIKKLLTFNRGLSFTLALVFFCFSHSMAQPEASHWCFGDSAHLIFTETGIVVGEQSSTFSNESFSTISDQNGELLLYSNGRHIWNRNHEYLPNGHHLHSKPGDPDFDVLYSTTQGTTILPDPGNVDRYYVISNVSSSSDNDGVFYCQVDMNLDGGLGDVMFGHQNVPLISGKTSEKMKAVRHANGRDWWLLTFDVPDWPEVDSVYYSFC